MKNVSTVYLFGITNSYVDLEQKYVDGIAYYPRCIKSDVVMPDMPINISFSINDYIACLSSDCSPVLCVACFNPEDDQIKILSNKITPNAHVFGSVNHKIFVENFARENLNAIIAPLQLYICVLDHCATDKVTVIFNPIHDEVIGLNSNDIAIEMASVCSGDAIVRLLADGHISQDVVGGLDTASISISASECNTVVAYFNTIDDISQYSISQTSSICLSDFFLQQRGD